MKIPGPLSRSLRIKELRDEGGTQEFSPEIKRFHSGKKRILHPASPFIAVCVDVDAVMNW